jgi:hypothetical protein
MRRAGEREVARREPMSLRAWWMMIAIGLAAPCAAQTRDTASTSPPDTSAAPALDAAVQPVTSTPPDYPRGRISGQMFGDVYYNANGDPTHLYTPAGADLGQANIADGGKPITQDLNGTQIRRVYFQLDNDFSEKYTSRLRLEVDGRSLTNDGKISSFVKNAYVQAKSVIPRGDFYFGMVNTPIWENSEEFWAYRSIEKTIADFRNLGSSSDLGIELKGFFDGDHRIGYAALVGDGQGQRPENDRYKKFYLSLPVRVGDLRLEPYVDYQGVRVRSGPPSDSLAVSNNDQATYKLFTGYEFRRFALGAEGVIRLNHRAGAPNQEPRGVSLFGRGTLSPTLGAFARVDFWSPDVRNPDRVDTRLWIAGIDWQPFKDVHVMPNIEAMQYESRGFAFAPGQADVQARITLFWKFSKPQS